MSNTVIAKFDEPDKCIDCIACHKVLWPLNTYACKLNNRHHIRDPYFYRKPNWCPLIIYDGVQEVCRVTVT